MSRWSLNGSRTFLFERHAWTFEFRTGTVPWIFIGGNPFNHLFLCSQGFPIIESPKRFPHYYFRDGKHLGEMNIVEKPKAQESGSHEMAGDYSANSGRIPENKVFSAESHSKSKWVLQQSLNRVDRKLNQSCYRVVSKSRGNRLLLDRLSYNSRNANADDQQASDNRALGNRSSYIWL